MEDCTPHNSSQDEAWISLAELIFEEEAKRTRNWDPRERWLALQAAITWAEAQATVRRNTKEACLANQARLLASLAAYDAQPKQ